MVGFGLVRRSRLGEEGWARKVKAVEARYGRVGCGRSRRSRLGEVR